MKSSGGETEVVSTEEKKDKDHKADDAHAMSDDKKKSEKKSEKHGKSADAGKKIGDVDFFRFSREFIIPLTTEGRITSLVIINLNLEVDSSESSKLFSIEPKLRDNIMSTLIRLSNDGSTLEEPTRVESYETIRTVVLANLRDKVSQDIENVLIVDIAKQEI